MSMSLYIFSDFTKPRATAYGELGGALNPLEACGMSKFDIRRLRAWIGKHFAAKSTLANPHASKEQLQEAADQAAKVKGHHGSIV